MPVFAGDIVNGKYRVERVLGEGGMGIVVAARHLELEELYAIKVMKREALGCDAYAERRFIGEARAAARLKGEHVARVHDIGRLDTGELYMVMEHLVGTDLNTVVRKRGPLPVEDAVTYVLQTCEAIAEAHALDIIHRDIKPHNLFLTKGGNSIKVLDFGISKQPPKQGPDLTGTNIILGTLLYMSPEQMAQSKTVDARSDVWSIGVVLYELVTGTVPFPGEGILEIAIRVSKGALTPPSQLRTGLPMAIDAIVERCLQKDPAQRFGSVIELAEALRSAMTTSSAWVTPPKVLQLVSPVVAPPVDPEPLGASVSDVETTNRRERNVAANPPRPVDRAEPGGHSSPDITASGESSYPEKSPYQRVRRAWNWAIGFGIIGVAALMIFTFNGWLLPPASTSQSSATIPEISPSGNAQPPGEISRETSPSVHVQPPSETTHEMNPSVEAGTPREIAHDAGPTVPVRGRSETTHELSPNAKVGGSSERSHEGSSRAKVRRPSQPSHDEGPNAQTPGVPPGSEPPAAPSGNPMPNEVSKANGAVSSAPGNEQASIPRPGTNSRCEALTDDRFPYLVDLSRSTRERRYQLIKNLTCDGDKAKTQLCCRSPTID